jgi:hypothetical protein
MTCLDRLRIVLCATLVMGLCASVVGTQTAGPSTATPTLTNDQKDVLRTLRGMRRAQWSRDVAAFEALTVDEFFDVDTTGATTTKVDWLRILRDEPPRVVVEPESASAPLVLETGQTLRILGTTAVSVVLREGATSAQRVQVVNVLVKQAKAWRVLFTNTQIVRDDFRRK